MNNIVWYNSPAKYWTDAIPMGNGFLGGMFFCSDKNDRIALNRDTLWTGFPREIKKDGAYEAYKKAQDMVLGGNFVSAQKELTDNFLTCWSQAYLPLGDLYIEHKFSLFGAKNYKRELNLETAVLDCEYEKNGAKITKEAFISNPADVLVYRITSSKGIDFSVNFKTQLRSTAVAVKDTVTVDGICPSDSGSKRAKYPCAELPYSDKPEEQGISFRTVIKVVSNGTVLAAEGSKIKVSGSTETTVFLCTKTNFKDGLTPPYKSDVEYKNACVLAVNSAVKKGYNALKTEHITDYAKYYSRTAFTLNKKSENSELPTNERLYAFKTDKSDSELYELFWNFAKYLMISSSRENSRATNLQGIWSENLRAPWNSNYTININTEMNYWPTLCFDMPELITPLFDLIGLISVTGKATARDYYKAGGFVAHHNSDIWGFTAPTYGDTQWGYWQGGSGWLCHSLFEYYEYTGDREFLSNTALPILKKACEFYSDILTNTGNEKLSVCPATSPENTFKCNDKSTSVAKSSAIMDTIVLDCFKSYLKACEITGISDEFTKKIAEQTEKIKPFKIGSQGQLLEWDDEYKECDRHHRHVSHLIGLHPFSLINKNDTPELFDACKKTLEIRGDAGTGWSLAWKINFHARLKNSDKAYTLLNMQLNPVRSRKKSAFNYGDGGGTYPNLFDAHPPFQIDGNFGAASGINEMLVQSDGKNVYLLPALPKEWKSGSVKGFRVKGNAKIDFSWKNGKVTAYELHTDNKDLKVITNRDCDT